MGGRVGERDIVVALLFPLLLLLFLFLRGRDKLVSSSSLRFFDESSVSLLILELGQPGLAGTLGGGGDGDGDGDG